MRSLFFSFLCLFLGFSDISQTNVSRTISSNTTWAKADSPLEAEYGQVDNINITVEDGINNVESYLDSLTVLPVNEYKPVINGLEILFGPKYEISGTPVEENIWGVELQVSYGQSKDDLSQMSILMNINSSDMPIVKGLPQTFNYVEDDPQFDFDPIQVEGDDPDEIFEFEIYQNYLTGKLASSKVQLSDFWSENMYKGELPLNEINQLLSSLSFSPYLNVDEGSKVEFKIRRKGGQLTYIGELLLNVTPINDQPIIEDIGLQRAFVGDSISFFAKFNDPEEGRLLDFSVNSLPTWMTYHNSKARDELVAGLSGQAIGFKLGKPSESQFYAPKYMHFDHDGNLLFTDEGLDAVFKLDFEKEEVTIFAGTTQEGNKLGPRLEAQFSKPTGIEITSDGTVYVNDAGNNQVKAILPSGEVKLIAGNGQAGDLEGPFLNASFNYLREIFVDEKNGWIYVNSGGKIRPLFLLSQYAHSLLFPNYSFSATSLHLDKNGDLLVGSFGFIYHYDRFGTLLRYYGAGGMTEPGDGSFDVARIGVVASIAENEEGQILFYDQSSKSIRKIDKELEVISTIAGASDGDYRSGIDDQIRLDVNGNILVRDGEIFFAQSSVIRKLVTDEHLFYGTPEVSDIGSHIVGFEIEDSEGFKTQGQIDVEVYANDRLDIHGLDTLLFIGEKQEVFPIPKIEILSSNINSVELVIERLNNTDISLGTSPNDLLEFDQDNERWLLTGSSLELNELLKGLKAYSTSFEEERLLFSFKKSGGILENSGSVLILVEPENDLPEYLGNTTYEVVAGENLEIDFLISDQDNDYVSLHLSGLPSFGKADSTYLLQKYLNPIYSKNLPDSTRDRLFIDPTGLAKNSLGEIYFADKQRNQVMKITSSSSYEAYVGSGIRGYKNGTRLDAEFNLPYRLTFDSEDNLIISDRLNASLRKVTADGQVETLIGHGSRPSIISFVGQDGYIDSAQPYDIYGFDVDSEGNLYTGTVFSVGKLNTDGYYEHIAGLPNYTGIDDVDGDKNTSRLGNVVDVVALAKDSLLIWDAQYYKLKLYNKGITSTLLGNGYGLKDGDFNTAKIGGVKASEQLKDGRIIFGAEYSGTIRMLDLRNDSIYTIIGQSYPGSEYGLASDLPYDVAKDFLELDNGDILIAAPGRIDRLTYTTPKVRFTPTLSDLGEHKFTLSVSDGKGGIVEEEITINVLVPNMAPEVTEIDDLAATFGDDDLTIQLFNYFSDAESADDELTYEVVSIDVETVVTANAISSTDGVLNLNIQGAGEANVTVKATDVKGESVTSTFSVAIAKAEAEIDLGELEFINDETEKPVTVSTVPAGLNYTLTYDEETDVPSTLGEYVVKVVIDEANYKGELIATLKVLNMAPEDVLLSNTFVFENSEDHEIGSFTATDQNPTDSHTFSLIDGEGDNGLFSLSEGKLSSKSSFNFEENTEYTIKVMVADNYGASFEKQLTIQVQDVNEAPTIDSYEEVQVVKNLGELTLQLSGISAGEDAGQTVSIEADGEGVVSATSVTLGEDGLAILNFTSEAGEEGEGIITITVKDDGGTAHNGSDTKVLEIPVKVLSANIGVNSATNCGPGQVTMTASGADNYAWYSTPLEGSPLQEGESYELELDASATYYVAGIFSGEESKLRVPITATIFDQPESPQVNNSDGTLSVTQQSDMSYQWYLDGQLIEGATDNTYMPNANGNYSLQITNENGCQAESESIEMIVTAIEEEASTIPVTVYPVPTSDYINLEFEKPLAKGATIRLIDNSGRELALRLISVPTQKVSLDIRSFASGSHTVLIQDGNRFVRKKVIIKK